MHVDLVDVSAFLERMEFVFDYAFLYLVTFLTLFKAIYSFPRY